MARNLAHLGVRITSSGGRRMTRVVRLDNPMRCPRECSLPEAGLVSNHESMCSLTVNRVSADDLREQAAHRHSCQEQRRRHRQAPSRWRSTYMAGVRLRRLPHLREALICHHRQARLPRLRTVRRASRPEVVWQHSRLESGRPSESSAREKKHQRRQRVVRRCNGVGLWPQRRQLWDLRVPLRQVRPGWSG